MQSVHCSHFVAILEHRYMIRRYISLQKYKGENNESQWETREIVLN